MSVNYGEIESLRLLSEEASAVCRKLLRYLRKEDIISAVKEYSMVDIAVNNGLSDYIDREGDAERYPRRYLEQMLFAMRDLVPPIKNHRDMAKKRSVLDCTRKSVIESAIDKTSGKFISVRDQIFPRGKFYAVVRYKNEEYIKKNKAIAISPNWLRSVYQRNIHRAIGTGNDVLIVSAKPKPSAFLESMNINAFYAQGITSSTATSATDGFVFLSDGYDGASRFVVFHTDFMAGSRLIQRRISNAVFGKVLD